MVRIITALLVLATLAGCGRVRDSAINPFNWFGRSTEGRATSAALEEVNPLIPRERASILREEKNEAYQGTLVQSLSQLAIEKAPGGAVIRVVALAQSLGSYDIRLVEAEGPTETGTLTFEMRAIQPATRAGQGTQEARRIDAAVFVSNQKLADIRTIRVTSAGNSRSARR